MKQLETNPLHPDDIAAVITQYGVTPELAQNYLRAERELRQFYDRIAKELRASEVPVPPYRTVINTAECFAAAVGIELSRLAARISVKHSKEPWEFSVAVPSPTVEQFWQQDAKNVRTVSTNLESYIAAHTAFQGNVDLSARGAFDATIDFVDNIVVRDPKGTLYTVSQFATGDLPKEIYMQNRKARRQTVDTAKFKQELLDISRRVSLADSQLMMHESTFLSGDLGVGAYKLNKCAGTLETPQGARQVLAATMSLHGLQSIEALQTYAQQQLASAHDRYTAMATAKHKKYQFNAADEPLLREFSRLDEREYLVHAIAKEATWLQAMYKR